MAELRFESTSVGYQGKEIVRDVNFSLDKGQILALVGPNGAGKSTILKTAARLLAPISGKVMIKEKELSAYPPAELSKIMSVMLTERASTEYATCFDVVRVGRYRYTDMFGRMTAEDVQAIERAMKLNGVYDLKDREFNRLSDGQKQRVLLARTMVSDPEIMILDEPTSFIDMGYKIEFFDVLKSVVRENESAVLISMHEIELVKRVAGKVVCISADNTIDRAGDPKEILTPEYMEELFSMSPGKFKEYYGSR